MSLEITYTFSLSAFKSTVMGSPIGRAATGLMANMTNPFYSQGSIQVQVTATAIPLGPDLTTPHWSYFANLDPTNTVSLMNGATGAVFLSLGPLEETIVPLSPSCIPYAIATNLPCQFEYLILSS